MLYFLQLLHLGFCLISLGLIFVCVFELRILLINSEVLEVINVAWLVVAWLSCCEIPVIAVVLIKGKNCTLHVTGVHPEEGSGPPLRG